MEPASDSNVTLLPRSSHQPRMGLGSRSGTLRPPGPLDSSGSKTSAEPTRFLALHEVSQNGSCGRHHTPTRPAGHARYAGTALWNAWPLPIDLHGRAVDRCRRPPRVHCPDCLPRGMLTGTGLLRLAHRANTKRTCLRDKMQIRPTRNERQNVERKAQAKEREEDPSQGRKLLRTHVPFPSSPGAEPLCPGTIVNKPMLVRVLSLSARPN